jgi:pre-mRNA-splicing helicase BRR2
MILNGVGAEQYARCKQFDYHTNSNLVLTAERSNRGVSGPTLTPESLWGRISGKMGDRAFVSNSKDLEKRKISITKIKKHVPLTTNLLNIGSYNYSPRTTENREMYEMLLLLIRTKLGDQPADILYGASEEVLAVLKNDHLMDPEKHSRIEVLLGKVETECFAHMVSIGKMINDFTSTEDKEKEISDHSIESTVGVAVEFENENEEVVEDEIIVIEEDHCQTVDDLYSLEQLRANKVEIINIEDEEIHSVKVQDIDAYWLQRQISKAFTGSLEANQSQKISCEVYDILSSDQDDREVENRLVMMLDFEKFDLIKMLLKNRIKIVWCTRLGRAQYDSERKNLEMQMEEAPETSIILQGLQATRTSAADRQSAMQKKFSC